MVPTASRSSSERDVIERGANRSSDTSGAGVRELRPLVEWLTALGAQEQEWVVSCYLKLEPRDRSRGKYLIKLKNRVKERLDWLERRGVSRDTREVVGRDLARVRGYLEHPTNLPPGRGIAIFASEALNLFETIPLPRVFRSRLSVDRSPLVRELAALDDEFGLVLCALYDRTTARFFQVTASDVEELTGMPAGDATRGGKFRRGRSVPGRGTGLAGAGEHNYHQRIQEEKQRHYAQIAQRLFELARGDAVRGIVLAGTGAEADAVRSHLHPYVEKRLMSAVRLNPKSATPQEVMEAVLEARREQERQWEVQAIETMAEGLGTGWAVNGAEPTLTALARGQVRTLLVDPMAELGGYRCHDSGRLTTVQDHCEGEGVPEPMPDIIDEAIEDALRQGSHVEVLEDQSARNQVDALAALLRFKHR